MNKLRSSRLLDRISPLVLADLRRMQAAAEAGRDPASQVQPAPLPVVGAGEFDKNQKNAANCAEIARYDPERGIFVMELRLAGRRIR
ncbi:hypothetical protein AB4156_23960 [Cupriavidus sp. 2MCAB6]|uniref:hypothetical protein n=1 Tax=Cupriavidus sp. 2MCAB6 TaxID=3232981 RepID=UPI003F92AA11